MSHSNLPPYIPYLKLYALAAAGIQTGMILCMTYPTIPSLLHGPSSNSTLLRIWSGIYNRGKKAMPPLSLTVSASFLAIAYRLKSTKYAVAGLLPPIVVPFTLTVMKGNLGKLLRWADEAGVNTATGAGGVKGQGNSNNNAEGEEVVGLDVSEVRREIDHWGILNVVRAMFPMAGFLVGLWATVF